MAFPAIHDARLFSISIDNDGLGEFQVELHDIGWAVKQLQAGEKVYRSGWNGANQFLMIMEPSRYTDLEVPYVYITTVDGLMVPWTCSQTDLLAVDWEEKKH